MGTTASAALLVVALAGAGAGAALLWVRRRLVVVLVQGESMAPTLRHGDRLLVRRAGLEQVRRRQIVVVRPADPGQPTPQPAAAAVLATALGDRPWLVKRTVALPGDPVPPDLAIALGASPGALVPSGRFSCSPTTRTAAVTPGSSDTSRATGCWAWRLADWRRVEGPAGPYTTPCSRVVRGVWTGGVGCRPETPRDEEGYGHAHRCGVSQRPAATPGRPRGHGPRGLQLVRMRLVHPRHSHPAQEGLLLHSRPGLSLQQLHPGALLSAAP
jgi:signal peptidase I